MSELHPLDRASALERIGPRHYRGGTIAEYWNFGGPFGGATVATLLRAVMLDEARIADPAAITLNFTALIKEGAFDVRVREIRAGKTIQHYYVELTQGEVVAANATIVCALRARGWRHQSAKAPAIAPLQDIPAMPTKGLSNFIQQFDFHFAEGAPAPRKSFDGAARKARSLLWVNNKIARAWDFIGLATICDIFFGRPILATGVFAPFATVSMTAHFHCDMESLIACGAGPLIGDADAHVFFDGISDQLATIWSPSGQLLATTTQIVAFKEPSASAP
jgi:acyl-CoA thioesterase